MTLEVWGNSETMNLNELVYLNLIQSRYFNSLVAKTTFEELIDEIYYNVSYLSPFVKDHIVSSAYCLMFRMFQLRLTIDQMNTLLNHADSPYIRAIGCLYLRYCSPPAELYDWFETMFDDDEEFILEVGKKNKISNGKLCKLLLKEQKFLGTMLPRIPVPIMREIEKKLAKESEPFNSSNSNSHHHQNHHSLNHDKNRHHQSYPSRNSRNDDYGYRKDDLYEERRSGRGEKDDRFRDNRRIYDKGYDDDDDDKGYYGKDYYGKRYNDKDYDDPYKERSHRFDEKKRDYDQRDKRSNFHQRDKRSKEDGDSKFYQSNKGPRSRRNESFEREGGGASSSRRRNDDDLDLVYK